MKSLRSLMESAGLGHFPARATVPAMLAVSAVLGLLFFALSGIPTFGFAGLVFGLIGTVEGLFGVARAREQSVTAALPEVVESLASAVSSGQSFSTAFADLAQHGPKALSKSISAMVRLDELGIPFDECLNWLRVELSDLNADSLIELLIASTESGGVGLVENLNRFAASLRAELVIRGELQAKQGWVTGTAKLALIAPWIVAWMLSRRAEAASFYCSAQGCFVLFIGLLVCVGAYLLIVRFGRLAKPMRVFA